MEPYFVTCETCRARLKVRKAEAIGQILACPRCESMVLITSPSAASGTGATTAANLRPRSQFARVETPSQKAADVFAAAAAAALATATVDEVAATEATSAAGPANVAATAGVKQALSGISLANLRPGVLAGVAGAAILTVGGITFALWPNGETPPAVVAAVNENTQAVEQHGMAAADFTPLTDESANELEVARSILQTQVDSSEKASKLTVTQAPAENLVEQVIQSPDQAESPAPIDLPTIAASDNHALATSSEAEPSAPVRTQVFKIDPLDFDPQNVTLRPPGAPRADNPPVVSESMIPPTGAATLAASDIPALPANERPPMEELDSITVRRGDTTGPAPRRQIVAAQLALPVRALSMKSVPLSQFVEQMADMSGMLITFDPLAVELTGISPQQPLALDVKDTTIERVLRDTLRRHRMDVVERDGRLVIVRAAASLPSKVDVSDLCENQTEAVALAHMIERFVAPESWAPLGGAGEVSVNGTTLEFKNADEPVIGLILFCERLRIARGLPMKSRYPAERLSVESPYAAIAPRFSQPTTFTFIPWTRLSDVFREWQAASAVTVLVDWSALTDVDLSPASPVSCSAIDRTWFDALDGVLTPLELGWQAIDGQTIQITSREKLASQRRLEFHAVSKAIRDQFANSDALVASLTDELRKADQRDGNMNFPAELAVDPKSGQLIALANAGGQRFLSERLKGE